MAFKKLNSNAQRSFIRKWQWLGKRVGDEVHIWKESSWYMEKAMLKLTICSSLTFPVVQQL
jgi:hypothetical protein